MRRPIVALVLLLAACRAGLPSTPAPADALAPARVARVRRYIAQGWQVLTRSDRDLPRAAPDPKVAHAPGTPWPVYLAADEDRAAVARRLTARLAPAERGQIELRTLPADGARAQPPGLLYLPEPYVVPGGRFNEMYGWDSYFIVLGLLRDGERERARQQTDDFL